MRIAANVFTCAAKRNDSGREGIIHENVQRALTALRGVDAISFHTLDSDAPTFSVPGLTQVRSAEIVIALGRLAHTSLADVDKRTLMSRGFVLDRDDEDMEGDLERLIWSCVNTSEVIALGEGAWRSIHMLPLSNRRFYQVPPLLISARSDDRSNDRILVIDHEEDLATARDLVGFLRSQYPWVAYAAPSTSIDIAAARRAWASSAFVHVHVGRHTIKGDDVRLVDTWQSRRVALQLAPYRRHADSDELQIEDEVNGFVCSTPEAVLACCEELRADVVLQKKVIDGGLRSVAPLALQWKAIAEDLSS